MRAFGEDIGGQKKPLSLSCLPVGGLVGQEGLDRGSGDDVGFVAVRVDDILSAFDGCDRCLAAWQQGCEGGGVEAGRLLHADRDLHAHVIGREARAAKERQSGMAQRILDRPFGRPLVVHPVQAVSHTHLDDETLVAHVVASIVKDTLMAALAMTVGLPSGRGTSSPPWCTVTRGWP